MTTRTHQPAGSDPGTSYETALRPALRFRRWVLGVLVFFVVMLANQVRFTVWGGAGEVATVVGFVLTGLPVAGALYALARCLSTRVWVQHSYEPDTVGHDRWTLHQTRFGRHTEVGLRSPHILRISGSSPFGPRPQWRLRVTRADDTASFSFSTPWLSDLPRVLELLRPAVARDRRLLADEGTRSLFA